MSTTRKSLLLIVAGFAMIVGLAGFTDPSGYYTLDLPPNWTFYKQIEQSDTVFCLNGDPRRGSIILSRTAQPHGKTLYDEAKWFEKYESKAIVSQEKITVAGQECLHVVLESKTNKGERLVTHMVICDVAHTPFPNATGIFDVTVNGIPGAKINPEAIFWDVVRSIKFTKP